MKTSILHEVIEFKLEDINHAMEITQHQFPEINWTEEDLKTKETALNLLKKLDTEHLESIQSELRINDYLQKNIIEPKLPDLFHDRNLVGEYPFEGPFHVEWNFMSNLLPESPGVYAFVLVDFQIIYPVGKSNVIYIGQSGIGIDKRIRDHITTGKNPGLQHYITNRKCAYYFLEPHGNMDIKNLENRIIFAFAEEYGRMPICNKKLGS